MTGAPRTLLAGARPDLLDALGDALGPAVAVRMSDADGTVPVDIGRAVIDLGTDPVEYERPAPPQPIERHGALVERLVGQGVFVVVLSSHHVFDGNAPIRRRDARRAPRGAFGRAAAGIEARAQALFPRAAVVRLARVLGARDPLLVKWRDGLKEGVPITPLAGYACAPIGVASVAALLARILDGERPGVFQASAAGDIAYEEIARRLCRALALPESRVRPSPATPADFGFASWPNHASLDMTLEAELGVAQPDADAVASRVVGEVLGKVVRHAPP